jgi:hypothetical protein
MSVADYNDLMAHRGHKIVIAAYGDPPVCVAVECLTCHEVLISHERFEEGGEDSEQSLCHTMEAIKRP